MPVLSTVRTLVGRFKPYLRWVIVGATLFFIGTVLRQNWAEVKDLRLAPAGWTWLGLGLFVTLVAHIWAGWAWGGILAHLGQPVSGLWSIGVYLRTNVAKYLPGNVWHLYGRVVAAKQAGISTSAATLSVLLEPLLMAAAALIIALTSASRNQLLQLVFLLLVLAAIHPRVLNPLLGMVSRLKQSAQPKSAQVRSIQPESSQPEFIQPDSAPSPSAQADQPGQAKDPLRVKRYPVWPLLREIGFVGLRGVGFVLTVWALQPVQAVQIPALVSAFSLAWVLGLVIPGAPGGIGVFEATALALLDRQFPASLILGSVALYRVISLLAEVSGAGLGLAISSDRTASGAPR
jgi:glycosyltransferase 2 family protein